MQRQEEVWLSKCEAGNVRAVKEPRKKVYQAKEESLKQLKTDFMNNEFPNLLGYIRAIARLQRGAREDEEIHDDDLEDIQGDEAPSDDSHDSDEEYDDDEA